MVQPGPQSRGGSPGPHVGSAGHRDAQRRRGLRPVHRSVLAVAQQAPGDCTSLDLHGRDVLHGAPEGTAPKLAEREPLPNPTPSTTREEGPDRPRNRPTPRCPPAARSTYERYVRSQENPKDPATGGTISIVAARG